MLTFDDLTHTYRWHDRRLLGVNETLERGGIVPGVWFDETARIVAAQRGTALHKATEYADAGRLNWDTLDPLLEAYVRAWVAFRSEHDVTIVETEHAVCNPDLGIAGTPDRFAILDGVESYLDLKTSARIDRWVRVQLAGYALGTRTIDGRFIQRRFVDRVVVHLRDDGTYVTHTYQDSDDLDVFMAAATVARWHEIGRRDG